MNDVVALQKLESMPHSFSSLFDLFSAAQVTTRASRQEDNMTLFSSTPFEFRSATPAPTPAIYTTAPTLAMYTARPSCTRSRSLAGRHLAQEAAVRDIPSRELICGLAHYQRALKQEAASKVPRITKAEIVKFK